MISFEINFILIDRKTGKREIYSLLDWRFCWVTSRGWTVGGYATRVTNPFPGRFGETRWPIHMVRVSWPIYLDMLKQLRGYKNLNYFE